VTSSPCWKGLTCLALTCGLLPGTLAADESVPFIEPACDEPAYVVRPGTSLAQLSCLGPAELDRLFCAAGAGRVPLGHAHGRVLLMLDAPHPQARARLAGTVWKGKYFLDDGSFINQWVGFQALHSRAVHGPSWCDGQPCIVMEYPRGTPVFANSRDELREIGPGLYLGRIYERSPHPRFRGYFALEAPACRVHKHY
jgi:hypothetical protein